MPEYIFTGTIAMIVALIEWFAVKERKKIELARQRESELSSQREKAREEMMVLLIQSNNAAIALGEATARAVQRIPDAHCNGDMHAALNYAGTVKHDMRDKLTARGVHAIWE